MAVLEAGRSPVTAPIDHTRLKRIQFRAWRRGFREADLILGPFADQQAPGLTPDQLDELERLLDEPDHDLYAWIVGQQPVPAEHAGGVLDLIRSFRFDARLARTDPGA